MKIMLLAGAMITLPAICVVLFFFGRPAMVPALVSLGINLLPFIVAGLLLRNSGTEGLGH